MQLQDLFDCRTCVNHVAQMYTKGIMTAYTNRNASEDLGQENTLIFGMHRGVEEAQAEEMLKRAFQPHLRIRGNEILQKQASNRALGCQITYDKAIRMMREIERMYLG